MDFSSLPFGTSWVASSVKEYVMKWNLYYSVFSYFLIMKKAQTVVFFLHVKNWILLDLFTGLDNHMNVKKVFIFPILLLKFDF